MRVLRNVAVVLAIGAVLAILSCVLGFVLYWVGLERLSTIFLWPFLALKPLIPCLPRGAPDCEGDAFASGTIYVSFALAVLEWSIITALVRRRR